MKRYFCMTDTEDIVSLGEHDSFDGANAIAEKHHGNSLWIFNEDTLSALVARARTALLRGYRVSLHEDKGDKFTILFDCQAEDEDHAESQALNAYPNGEVIHIQTWGDVPSPMSRDTMLATLRNMRGHGGSFVKALAEAWARADDEHSARLAAVFPDLLKNYAPERWERETDNGSPQS